MNDISVDLHHHSHVAIFNNNNTTLIWNDIKDIGMGPFIMHQWVNQIIKVVKARHAPELCHWEFLVEFYIFYVFSQQ